MMPFNLQATNQHSGGCNTKCITTIPSKSKIVLVIQFFQQYYIFIYKWVIYINSDQKFQINVCIIICIPEMWIFKWNSVKVILRMKSKIWFSLCLVLFIRFQFSHYDFLELIVFLLGGAWLVNKNNSFFIWVLNIIEGGQTYMDTISQSLFNKLSSW